MTSDDRKTSLECGFSDPDGPEHPDYPWTYHRRGNMTKYAYLVVTRGERIHDMFHADEIAKYHQLVVDFSRTPRENLPPSVRGSKKVCGCFKRHGYDEDICYGWCKQ